MWPFSKKKTVSKSYITEGITIVPTVVPSPQPDAKPEYEDGYVKEYPSFTAKVIEKIDNGKGYWNYLDIGVFQQDVTGQEPYQIGQYRRNYSSFYNTFSVTRKGDNYFALYSPSYTTTRVLEITPGVGIKDIGGEDDPDGAGFCPTDLYIPTLREFVSENYTCGPSGKIKDWAHLLDFYPSGTRIGSLDGKSPGRTKIEYEDGRAVRAYIGDEYKWVWGPQKDFAFGHVVLPPKHAFVAGCHWGDDSSWKIQYIDVSRIDEGIIVRDDRFGYIELPSGLSLKKAIDMEDLEESDGRIKIAVDLKFDIKTGGIIDWDDLKAQIEKGQPIIDEVDDGHRKFNQKGFDEEMKRRWHGAEGEAVRKIIKKIGGEIR